MSRCRDFADLAAAYGEGSLSQRNMIMNGNMLISERTGTTATTAIGYTLDRWKILSDNLDELAFEVTQTNDVPATFAGGGGKSLKYQTKTVESALASTENFRISQQIEAQNCHRVLYGTSSAKSVTLSFWVKSSLTGVFAVMLYMEDGGLNIGSTYTISSADTWEYKTITFVGNTSQAISHDNTIGFYVQFWLMAGSSYVTTSNTSWDTYAAGRAAYGHAQNGLATTDESTWQLTGVQMEVGEVATEFEHEAYGDTLAKCQRYLVRVPCLAGTATYGTVSNGYAYDNNTALTAIPLPVEMRAIPAVTKLGGLRAFNPANDDTDISGIVVDSTRTNPSNCYIDCTTTDTNLTAGEGVIISRDNDADGGVLISAEL
jgi:hypothetical protein